MNIGPGESDTRTRLPSSILVGGKRVMRSRWPVFVRPFSLLKPSILFSVCSGVVVALPLVSRLLCPVSSLPCRRVSSSLALECPSVRLPLPASL